MGLLRPTDPMGLLGAPLTYPAVGTACSGEVPEGFRGASRSAVVGRGRVAQRLATDRYVAAIRRAAREP